MFDVLSALAYRLKALMRANILCFQKDPLLLMALTFVVVIGLKVNTNLLIGFPNLKPVQEKCGFFNLHIMIYS